MNTKNVSPYSHLYDSLCRDYDTQKPEFLERDQGGSGVQAGEGYILSLSMAIQNDYKHICL